jgi:uncharacterized membrane protein required for colicin V production
MQLQNFSKIFKVQKKGIWTGTNIQKKLFLNFFHRFLGVFVPVPKAKKWYFSDFLPVLNVNLECLKNKNLIFSLLVPVLNPKSTTISHLVPVQRPQEIDEKNSKKAFLDICTGPNTT